MIVTGINAARIIAATGQLPAVTVPGTMSQHDSWDSDTFLLLGHE